MLSVLLYSLLLVSVVGCTGANASPVSRTAKESRGESSLQVDAGIVLADRDGYLCMPLEHFGFEADAKVQDVTSSCECVQPSIVDYVRPNGDIRHAILLQYVRDPEEDDISGAATSQAVTLGVIIDVTFSDGTSRQITVKLLHSSLIRELTP